MKRYYIPENELKMFLVKLSVKQEKANSFENVTVKDYKGKKYPKETEVVIVG